MNEIQYKDFSWKTHEKNWQAKKPNVCQFELTFKCDLHCKHCYTDCYNSPEFVKKELDTEQVKKILDKVYEAGCIWVCFTGGDPLTRHDFLEIYDYAKRKGVIITIFTNAYSITDKIADHLAKNPPFVIEMTLNSVFKDLYEGIAGIKGSFERVMQGIDLIMARKIELKIKTQVTKANFEHLPEIKKFLEARAVLYRPNVFLHARLDGNLMPCSLRVAPEKLFSDQDLDKAVTEDCGAKNKQINELNDLNGHSVFTCAITGGDGIYIDPYGNIVPCNCIREPKVSLLSEDVKSAQEKILSWVRSRVFNADSICKVCAIKEKCYSCPGKSWLEKGRLDAPVEWFCEAAKKNLKGITG